MPTLPGPSMSIETPAQRPASDEAIHRVPVLPIQKSWISQLLTRHPLGLFALVLIEMGERTGFFLTMALFARYLNEYWKFSDAKAFDWFGTFISVAYLTPLFGGYLAGGRLRRTTAVVIGALLLGVGYLGLAQDSQRTLIVSIGIMALGNGFFKPNIVSLAGNLYTPSSPMRDEGFSIFYMSINIGGVLGPVLGEAVLARWGWHAAFYVAASALFGSAGIALLAHRLLAPANYQRAEITVVPRTHKNSGAARVATILVLCLAMCLYWLAFYQSGSSLAFLARDGVTRTLWGMEIPPGYFQASNSLFVLLFTVPLAFVFNLLLRRGKGVSSITKMVLGMLITALSFLLVSALCARAGNGKLPALGLFGFYAIFTIGELLISPVGISIVSKLSPPRWVGVLFGMWFLSTACGNKLSGVFASRLASAPRPQFFNLLGMVLLAVTGCLLLGSRFLRRVVDDKEPGA